MTTNPEPPRPLALVAPDEAAQLAAGPAAGVLRLIAQGRDPRVDVRPGLRQYPTHEALAAAAAPAADTPPRYPGRVESGPGAAYAHLAFLLGDSGWATACSGDTGGGDPWGRQVRPVFALVDCPDCLSDDRDLVDAVNREVAERQRREAMARELLLGFLRWSAEEYPVGEGGAVLALYAGGTRLHAMRAAERERAVDLWLESSRPRPGGA